MIASPAARTRVGFIRSSCWAPLEDDPEAELKHARLICHVRAPHRTSVRRADLLRSVAPIVGSIEEIERLNDSRNGTVAAKRKRALHAQVDAVDRLAHEVVARHDRTVGTQPQLASAADIAQVGAVARGVALARAVEIEPAQLKA